MTTPSYPVADRLSKADRKAIRQLLHPLPGETDWVAIAAFVVGAVLAIVSVIVVLIGVVWMLLYLPFTFK